MILLMCIIKKSAWYYVLSYDKTLAWKCTKIMINNGHNLDSALFRTSTCIDRYVLLELWVGRTTSLNGYLATLPILHVVTIFDW